MHDSRHDLYVWLDTFLYLYLPHNFLRQNIHSAETYLLLSIHKVKHPEFLKLQSNITEKVMPKMSSLLIENGKIYGPH